MYNWNADAYESHRPSLLNLVLFAGAALLAILLFLIFAPQIHTMTSQTPLFTEMMYLPAALIGFLFGLKITEKAIKPSETRSPIKRGIIKIFLAFFIIGGLFSSVSFALNGGIHMPESFVLEVGLIDWMTSFALNNGGLTFLIVSSISLMAIATKRIIGLDGITNSVMSFIGTFTFFSMIAMSLAHTEPSHSQVYLYAFYHAGIIIGALFKMNQFTSNLNFWEDFSNGYK
jgi:hypothetical protein